MGDEKHKQRMCWSSRGAAKEVDIKVVSNNNTLITKRVEGNGP